MAAFQSCSFFIGPPCSMREIFCTKTLRQYKQDNHDTRFKISTLLLKTKHFKFLKIDNESKLDELWRELWYITTNRIAAGYAFYQDHLTKFSILRPHKTKEAVEVALYCTVLYCVGKLVYQSPRVLLTFTYLILT